jgi:hypothetical protein
LPAQRRVFGLSSFLLQFSDFIIKKVSCGLVIFAQRLTERASTKVVAKEGLLSLWKVMTVDYLLVARAFLRLA